MFKKHIIITILSLVVSGCVESTDELKTNPKSLQAIKHYSVSYQEVYRRIVTTAKRCQSGTINAYASMQVDAELYSELGRGEISQRLTNWGVNTYYWQAIIEKKTSNSSKLTVVSGSTVNNSKALKRIMAWANGIKTCNGK